MSERISNDQIEYALRVPEMHEATRLDSDDCLACNALLDLKEARAEIERLKAENAELKKRLRELEESYGG